MAILCEKINGKYIKHVLFCGEFRQFKQEHVNPGVILHERSMKSTLMLIDEMKEILQNV